MLAMSASAVCVPVFGVMYSYTHARFHVAAERVESSCPASAEVFPAALRPRCRRSTLKLPVSCELRRPPPSCGQKSVRERGRHTIYYKCVFCNAPFVFGGSPDMTLFSTDETYDCHESQPCSPRYDLKNSSSSRSCLFIRLFALFKHNMICSVEKFTVFLEGNSSEASSAVCH